MKILIVDDNTETLLLIEDILVYLGYSVYTAQDGNECLRIVKDILPSLIILDVMMPELDGYETCYRLKADEITRRIPILMLTAKSELQDKIKGFRAGVDDFLTKPYEKEELEARVQALLRRTAEPPFIITHDETTLLLSCMPSSNINIRVTGAFTFNSITRLTLNMEDDIMLKDEQANTETWRSNSKIFGKRIYRHLFSSHPEILSHYNQALGDVKNESKLHIRIETSRKFFQTPMEMIFEDIDDYGDYLVLKHPFSRYITGVRTRKPPLSPEFLNKLWLNNGSLNILIIVSNTEPLLTSLDTHASILKDAINSGFKKRGLSLNIEVIYSRHATYDRIKGLLHKCQYHIVHYMGHGYHDKEKPERSYLPFWENDNCSGDIIEMKVPEMSMLVKNSKISFFYLSCCKGSSNSFAHKLLEEDFLGIADGLIHAGTPSVLGFRWPISEESASLLAISFYQSLVEHGQLDAALLDARWAVASQNRNDIVLGN